MALNPSFPKHGVFLFMLAAVFALAATPALAQARHILNKAPRPQARAAQAADPDSRLGTLIQQAQTAQKRGDYQGAADAYLKVLELQPHLAEVRTNLGLMYHLLGEYTKAADQFELALRDKPDLFVPNLFLGLDLLELHSPQGALRYLDRAQHLNPQDQQTVMGLARANAALRDYQHANDWYWRAAELNPNDSEALYGLGITYLDLQTAAASELGKSPGSFYDQLLLAQLFLQQGRVNDAVNLYKRLTGMNALWPGLRTALGFAYVRSGQIPAAEAQFQAELSQNPGFLLARVGLARIVLEQGDSPTCLRRLLEVWKIDRSFLGANIDTLFSGLGQEKTHALAEQVNGNAPPLLDEDLRNVLRSGLTQLQQGARAADASIPVKAGPPQGASPGNAKPEDLFGAGRYSDCRQKLKEAHASLDHSGLMLLCRCAYYVGDYRTTLTMAGQALREKPGDLESLYWRGASASNLALHALLRAGVIDPNSNHVHLLLGEAYRTMNKADAAETEYRKALELKPRDPAAQLGLATLFWQSRRYDDALPLLQDVLAQRSGDPEASYLMGDILVGRREYAEARPFLTAALAGSGKTVYYAHASLGKIYAAEGQGDKAIRELQSALPGDDDGSFHVQISQLYKKTGNQQAAAEALRQSEAIRQRQAATMRGAMQRNE